MARADTEKLMQNKSNVLDCTADNTYKNHNVFSCLFLGYVGKNESTNSILTKDLNIFGTSCNVDIVMIAI